VAASGAGLVLLEAELTPRADILPNESRAED
jgi:hypothetical protein